MKKTTLYMLACLGILVGTQSCENPLKDVNILVSSEILQYTTMLQVSDTEGTPLSDLTVRITGRDAEYIYNLDGRKQFNLNGGLLGLGVHPEHQPAPGSPIQFRIELSGNGYLTQVIPVTIGDQQFSSVNAVSLLNLNSAPAGVTVYAPSATLTDNAIAQTLVISTPLDNATEQALQITLPAGTQFQDADGNTLSGSTLTASIITADTDKPDAVKVFPGGSLATDNIIPAGSSTAVSGTFNPAALTSVEFFLDGAPVKRFSQPIQISQQLDPAFHNSDTDAPVAAGDALSVYSYTTADARWQYEQNATVALVGGVPTTTFQTDHLTWFLSGNFLQACAQPATVQLNASWFDAGVSYPLTIEAVVAGKVAISFQLSVSADSRTAQLNYLPTQGATIRVKDERGALLGEAALTGTCGGTTTISLSDPTTVTDPTVTLQLYVRCPSQSEVITVLPTFYLYYREAGTDSDFAFLGVVTNGFLSTKMLTVDDVAYDFKAVWGNQVKIVNGHTVQEDNSGTVGIQPGDIIGEKAGASNLTMLTQKCNE